MTKFICALAVLSSLVLPPSAFAGWEVEPSHTNISFEVGHLGLTRTPGQFKKFAAQVAFDAKRIEASRVTFTIDAASVDTAFAARDAMLRGSDWFDAQNNPNITFASTSVRRVDDKNYVIAGDLTVRGKTLPVSFDATLTNRIVNPFLNVPAVGFVATARVKRTDFGMAGFLPAVADAVDLRVQLEMNQKP